MSLSEGLAGGGGVVRGGGGVVRGGGGVVRGGGALVGGGVAGVVIVVVEVLVVEVAGLVEEEEEEEGEEEEEEEEGEEEEVFLLPKPLGAEVLLDIVFFVKKVLIGTFCVFSLFLSSSIKFVKSKIFILICDDISSNFLIKSLLKHIERRGFCWSKLIIIFNVSS
jgi:hypothetical protein